MALTEKELKRIADIQDRINRGVKIQENTQIELNNLLKKQNAEQQKLNKQFQLGAKAQRQSTSFAEKEKKLIAESEKSFSNRIQNLAKGNFLQALGLDKTTKARKEEISLASKANQLSKTILTTEGQTAEQKVALQDLTKDIVDGAVEEREEIEKRISSLNVDENVKDAILGKAQKLFDQEQKTTEELEKSNEKAAQFSKAVGIAGAIFASLVATATKFGGIIDKIGQTFGSLNVLGEEVTNNLLNSSIEATKLGGSIDDVASITNTLASNFGMSLEEASALSAKVFDTSKALGLSADESANLFGSLTQVANLSAKQAEQLTEGTFQLARQRGVAPTAVLKDLAQSAETIAEFTKDGGNNIAEAAVQARALGVSLDTTAKISKGLLDFETSLTNEIEASVMIGKQLNFERARQLALEGDIAGATKDVVAQLGSEAEFNKLNVLQREALAKSIGVSVGELAKLVGQSDKLSLSGALAAGNFEDLLGSEGISNITKLTQEFAALGATLTNSLGPILSVAASGINLLLSPFAGLINFVEKFVGLGPALLGLLVAIKGKAMASAAANAVSAVAGFFKGASLASIASAGFATPVAIGAAIAASAALFKAMSSASQVNDFHSGPGGITHMTGPAGTFELNPRDSVLATTNPIPVNDVLMTAPAGGIDVGGNSDGVLNTLASAVNGLVEKGIGITGTFDNFGDAISFAGERQPGTVQPVGTRVS